MNRDEMSNEELLKLVSELEKEMIIVKKEKNHYYEESKLLNSIVSVLVDCGFMDVNELIAMESNFPGTTESAKELLEEIGGQMNYGLFVRAVKERALEEVSNELNEEQVDVLYDLIIDDNYLAWGGIAAYGSPSDILSHEAQEAFVEYVRTGEKEDKNTFISIIEAESKDKTA